MPLELWAEAVNTAVYLLNRCTTKVLENSTPYEIWYKRKPSILHLKTFGCNAYVHIPKDNRKKLDKKSIRTFFVGYTETNKNYRMWDPIVRKIIISSDVIFTEANTSENIQDNQQEQVTIYSEESVDNTNISSKPEESCRYPLRNRIREKEQSSTNCTRAISYACYVHDQEPMNYEDAIVGQNSKKWKLAMDDEFNSLMKNQTWTYVGGAYLSLEKSARLGCLWLDLVVVDSGLVILGLLAPSALFRGPSGLVDVGIRCASASRRRTCSWTAEEVHSMHLGVGVCCDTGTAWRWMTPRWSASGLGDTRLGLAGVVSVVLPGEWRSGTPSHFAGRRHVGGSRSSAI
ncbi:hypothetical protein LAZ67_2003325 [Cordylochernes scorpioides]|uniref:Retroviral polymerase SH3-like domain-containing protein n=1 Tax=Cordylochernes scorpioides TaxID=51811 RepID=A0ABY6K2Q6_9ARAC|nr:hypothetical protein LAZ67_2003325 [Cordylochernes scorpioides]